MSKPQVRLTPPTWPGNSGEAELIVLSFAAGQGARSPGSLSESCTGGGRVSLGRTLSLEFCFSESGFTSISSKIHMYISCVTYFCVFTRSRCSG